MIEIAIAAARAAGTIQRERLNSGFEIRHKGAVDLVTEVDLACEHAIREILARRAPGTTVLAEEEGVQGNSSDRWVVDPLDGTTNFAHGYPAFCVSIAWEEAGETCLGVVYDPIRNELFQAQRGKGSLCNGEKLRVTSVGQLSRALLATGFPYDRAENPRNYKEFVYLTQLTQGVRRSGSAALDLSYVACGRLDGFWEFNLQPWDLAAGCLVVREAGGMVSGFGGAPFSPYSKDVVASNGELHQPLLTALNDSSRFVF